MRTCMHTCIRARCLEYAWILFLLLNYLLKFSRLHACWLMCVTYLDLPNILLLKGDWLAIGFFFWNRLLSATWQNCSTCESPISIAMNHFNPTYVCRHGHDDVHICTLNECLFNSSDTYAQRSEQQLAHRTPQRHIRCDDISHKSVSST